MPHVLGDHNRAIVELYLAEFDTEEGPLILECWSMDPMDAAIAFRKFFSDDHPDRKQLSDNSRLKEHEAFSNEWNEIRDWWRAQTIWSGEHVEMEINPGTRLTIGETVIEYSKSSYLTWSGAYPSTKEQIVESTYLSSRDHAILD